MNKKLTVYKYVYNDRVFYGQGLDEQDVRTVLETKLNIPHKTLQEGVPVFKDKADLIKGGNIIVKTHKFIKKNIVTLDRNNLPVYNVKIEKIIDRKDEIIEVTDALLSEDLVYFAKMRLAELEDRINTVENNISKIKIKGYSTLSMENELEKLNEERAILESRNYNTGYLVYSDIITDDAYRQIDLDSIYRIYRKRLISHNLQDLTYDENWTLLEKLDSFMLNPDQTNRYARLHSA